MMMKNPTGGYTIGIDYQYELRNPAKAPAPGTVTGGREGSFLGALGSSILDGGKAIVELPFNLGGPTPPPKTATTTQQ